MTSQMLLGRLTSALPSRPNCKHTNALRGSEARYHVNHKLRDKVKAGKVQQCLAGSVTVSHGPRYWKLAQAFLLKFANDL